LTNAVLSLLNTIWRSEPADGERYRSIVGLPSSPARLLRGLLVAAAAVTNLGDWAWSLPVVLAGGSRLEDDELLQRMEHAMAAGAIGCSVGRNIFMHRSPEAITRALSRVIRERWKAAKAMEALHKELGAGAVR